MIKVVVCGAAGRMGREVLRAVWQADDLELAGAVDPFAEVIDAGALMGMGDLDIPVRRDLKATLRDIAPDVVIDFTNPQTVYANTCIALECGVRPVVGTTGMSADQLAEIKEMASRYRIGCIVAPNFAIGALLMMKFASEACKYFPYAEIIELHHEKKCDAPSGTAIKTAELISRNKGSFRQIQTSEVEKLPGARGANFEGGIRIHSVRLPGMMAHQEVIFGGLGQTLTLRHDSISRESFMPGVVMAVRKVMELAEMIYGLENIIFENSVSDS